MTEIVYCRRCKLPITDKHPAHPYFPDLHLASSYTCPKLLRAKLGLALAALRSVEWMEFDGGLVATCPWCKRARLQGHTADCPRQVALGIGTQEMVNYE